MSDWGWVVAGFVTAYGAILAYLVALRGRMARARRRRLEELP